MSSGPAVIAYLITLFGACEIILKSLTENILKLLKR
jgi:hypothetical protein